MAVSAEFLADHYSRHYRHLVKSYSRKFDNDTIGQDVVQEAYTRAWKYRESYDDSFPFENWFSVICRNSFMRLCAEELGHAALDIDDHDLSEGDPGHESNRLWAQLLNLIDKERPEVQEVLRFHLEYGYTVTEISEFYTMSHRNIRNNVSLFKLKLRRLLE